MRKCRPRGGFSLLGGGCRIAYISALTATATFVLVCRMQQVVKLTDGASSEPQTMSVQQSVASSTAAIVKSPAHPQSTLAPAPFLEAAESVGPASARNAESSISAEKVVATALRLQAPIREILSQFGQARCGTGELDGIALLSVASLAKVDVMLESGTSVGRSAEMMARFFAGTHVKVYTVDFGSESKGGICAANVSATHQRLSRFKNLTPRIGDSFAIFPELLRAHSGQRVGLWIDGPKNMLGVKLCIRALKVSADVQFCAFHDVRAGPRPIDVKALKFFRRWQRTVLLTCCSPQWLHEFNASSTAIVLGSELRLGVQGDESAGELR